VKQIFDGYDVGIRYADDALGALTTKLDDLGVLDDTAILVSSDHGEMFGELGVYADHQAADEATCHIPAVLRWPGTPAGVHEGLQYHLDIAATVLENAGLRVPRNWDGEPITRGAGREHLVLSQGAWACQRGVRFGDHLYLRTWHDGYHPHWAEEMLFDVRADPHEMVDLAPSEPATTTHAAAILDEWTATQLDRSPIREDPMDVVRREGGPYHVRQHLPAYLERLRATDRGDWADALEARHPDEVLTPSPAGSRP
jgi:arylsulfatase A-like enzyme